jgi:hypothetical protein
MSFEKILTHPDKNTIVKMLAQGQGVRMVSKYLREKYPSDKKMHISVPTLQAFRRQKLNLEGEALEAVKQATKERAVEKQEKHNDTKLKRLPAYQEKIKEIVDYHVDIQKELKELFVLAKARMEDLFDKAARGEITINEEANLQRYFQIITTNIERWAKYVEKNVNITVIEEQMSVMRDAVREIIGEMSPDLALKFLDRLSQKMATLSYRPKSNTTFAGLKNDVEIGLLAMESDAEGADVDGIR